MKAVRGFLGAFASRNTRRRPPLFLPSAAGSDLGFRGLALFRSLGSLGSLGSLDSLDSLDSLGSLGSLPFTKSSKRSVSDWKNVRARFAICMNYRCSPILTNCPLSDIGLP